MAWFLRLIGIGSDFVEHLEEVRFAFQRPAILWLGLALLVPLGILIYRRQRQNLGTVSRGLIMTLSSIRILILALLVAVLAGPYLKIDHKNEQKPIVAVLIDNSQSMLLPAGQPIDDKEQNRLAEAAGYPLHNGQMTEDARRQLNRASRIKLTNDVLQRSGPAFFEPLAKKYDLRTFTFARELVPLSLDPGRPTLIEPGSSAGSTTHVGDALAQILAEAAGRQVAGIVVFSDGQSTGGRSMAEAAHAAADARVPVFAVPTGSSRRLRDVAIVDVFTSGQVAVGDTARVAVTLESQEFDGRPVKVELREGDKLLDAKDLVLRGSEQQQIELTFRADQPGPRYLTVHVPPLPEEPAPLHANNTDTAFVRVSDEKLKVLYVEGLPRWDFRFLKNALRRDHGLGGNQGHEPDILLEAELRRHSPEQSLALPSTLDDLAKYRTVILGDASPSLLNAKFMELLAEAVRERGVGLIVAAGPQAMPHLYGDDFKALLPVRLRPATAGMEAPAYKPFRLELTPDGAVQEALRLYDEQGRNQNVWTSLPPYYWCASVERSAPAATVLMWNPSVQGRYGKLPLISHQYAGKGRVLFLGTDSTFLWRQNVGDRFFYKFWGQSIRFVARRDDAAQKKSWLEIRPARAQPGEQVQVELMAIGPDGSPRMEPKQLVRLTGENGADTVEMSGDPNAKGRYTGRFVPAIPGEYRLTYDSAEARFRVLTASEELRQPNVNRPALELLASTSGGRLVELPDLASIPEKLQGDSRFSEFHRETSIWDNWLLLTVLITLYSVDVGLRRLTGLS